jgi:hypothetical protein
VEVGITGISDHGGLRWWSQESFIRLQLETHIDLMIRGNFMQGDSNSSVFLGSRPKGQNKGFLFRLRLIDSALQHRNFRSPREEEI